MTKGKAKGQKLWLFISNHPDSDGHHRLKTIGTWTRHPSAAECERFIGANGEYGQLIQVQVIAKSKSKPKTGAKS